MLFNEDVTEPDLLKIGAGTVIEAGATLQPHKWEAEAQFYANTSIGAGCVIQYVCCRWCLCANDLPSSNSALNYLSL